MARPKLMLLDEPSMGLAPMVCKRSHIVVRMNREEQVAILLAEQCRHGLPRRAVRLCHGKWTNRTDGEAKMLRENEDVKEFYLGLDRYRTAPQLSRCEALTPPQAVALLKSQSGSAFPDDHPFSALLS